MLTIRFDRLALRTGDRVLDVGAGFGRHAFEIARRGGRVVALDHAHDEVERTRATIGAMIDAGEITPDRFVGVLRGDATRLPFADGSFDVVLTSEVLEHIQDDVGAIAEMVRVLRPGGVLSGSAVLNDTGFRYEPMRQLGRVANLLGPSCTTTELAAWLAEAGIAGATLRTSGAMCYFRGVRS